jgi:hypothetical protein
MNTIKQTPKTIEFISSLSPVARILLAIFGFIPLLAPYELLIKPSWSGQVNFVLIFFLVISLGAVLVSLFLFMAAFFGRSQHFLFNASSRRLIYRFKTAFNPAGQEIYSFDQIKSFEIKVSEWDSRPDTYDIVVEIAGKPEMKFGNFPSRPDAEGYLTALQNMLTNRQDYPLVHGVGDTQ